MTDFRELLATIEKRGWSRGRIAEKIGCARSTVYALADGRNKQPGYDLGVAIVDLERRTRPRKMGAANV